jgi:hypothetical protein
METSPVEESQPRAALAAAPIAPVSRGSIFARAWEWLWRGAALAQGRAALTGASELERRARLAATVAAHAFEPRERFAAGDAAFLGCELYREAAYWCLRALTGPRTRLVSATERERTASRAEREALWQQADAALLLRVAGDTAVLAQLRAAFVDSSFADFAELPADQQARLATQLRALSAALLEQLDAPQRELDLLLLQRLTRTGALLAAAAIALLVTVRVLDKMQPDLARGRAWRASSEDFPGCKSPQQDCDDSPYYFFHTRAEANPWVEIDLGAERTFSQVKVKNREDCCLERAVPLVVEVSNDRKQWMRLAQKTSPFTSWTADFASTRARWVRVRVQGRGPLHLKQVRVLP